MKSLQEFSNKINPKRSFFILLSILLVSVGMSSFALGRISAQYELKQDREEVRGVFIDTSASEPFFEAEEARKQAPKTIMASKNGTRYYTAGCKAGGNIKEENRVWFSTENEAKMAGYTIAKSCAK